MAVEVARLSKVPLFDDLSEDQRSSLASWLDEEEARAGHAVTYEGASGYAFFVIEHGEARVMHGDEELRRLRPGDFFGEAAILGDGRRTADWSRRPISSCSRCSAPASGSSRWRCRSSRP